MAHRPRVLVLFSKRSEMLTFSEKTRRLLESFADVVYSSKERSLIHQEILERISEVEGVMSSWEMPLTKDHIQAATNLRIIGRRGGSVSNIDTDAALARGIVIVNTPDGYVPAVAEFSLGLTICALRGIIPNAWAMRNGTEDGYRLVTGTELYHKTVGLVGLGRIGSELARLLHPFGVNILAYDPYVSDGKFRKLNIKKSSMVMVMSESDIVYPATQLSRETQGLISERELKMLKDGALLVNISRGPIVDEDALLRELRTGRIRAALDVYSKEPLSHDHELRRLPNVILTSHMAGLTPHTCRRGGEMLVQDFKRFFEGKEPKNRLSVELIRKMS